MGHKQVYADQLGLYTIEWEDLGNRDLAHKTYLNAKPVVEKPTSDIEAFKVWLEEAIGDKKGNLSKNFTTTGWDAARLQLEAYKNVQRKIQELGL